MDEGGQPVVEAVATQVAAANAQEAETAAIVAVDAAQDAVASAAVAEQIADEAAREEVAEVIAEQAETEQWQTSQISDAVAGLQELRTSQSQMQAQLTELTGAVSAMGLLLETMAAASIQPTSSEQEQTPPTEEPELEAPPKEGGDKQSEAPKEAEAKRKRFRRL